MPQKLLQYEVIESLGEGARSKIYLVRDPQTRQLYTLKHVVRADAKDIRFIEQMETEFELCRQFTHPNLRKAFDLKIVKTMLLKVSEAFMVMEYVEGKALDVKLPNTMLQIVDCFIQVAQGMKAIHQMGYVHCDMKPNNIVLSSKGVAKVIDYGQSCRIGTIKERIQGTPDFIAPEQVDRRPVTVQTDVFNLGATLYWCATGRHIPTLYTVNKKGDNSFLLDATIQSPMELNPRVPAAVNNLVMECIATRPAKRPTEMDQIISRLELGKHVLQKAATPDPFSKTA